MRDTWARPELHEDWLPIEDQIAKSGMKLLFGFWVTIAAFGGAFWTLNGGFLFSG